MSDINLINNHLGNNSATVLIKMTLLAAKAKPQRSQYIILPMVECEGYMVHDRNLRSVVSNFVVKDDNPRSTSKKKIEALKMVELIVTDINLVGNKLTQEFKHLGNVTSVGVSESVNSVIFQSNVGNKQVIAPIWRMKTDSDHFQILDSYYDYVADPIEMKKFRFNGFEGDDISGLQIYCPINRSNDLSMNQHQTAKDIAIQIQNSNLAERHNLEVAVWVNGILVYSKLDAFKLEIAHELLSLPVLSGCVF